MTKLPFALVGLTVAALILGLNSNAWAQGSPAGISKSEANVLPVAQDRTGVTTRSETSILPIDGLRPLDDTVLGASPVFAEGRWTAQFLSGAYFAPTIVGPVTQSFDFVPFSLRFGYLLNTPEGGQPDWLSGAWEGIIDGTVAAVTHGPGSIVGGPSLLLRYNFVQPSWPLVPYIQAGAGFTFNDIYRDQVQHAIGESLEFLLQAGWGLRYLVSPDVSLDLESSFIHISNAGLAQHNGGINAVGVSIGFTYYFKGPR